MVHQAVLWFLVSLQTDSCVLVLPALNLAERLIIFYKKWICVAVTLYTLCSRHLFRISIWSPAVDPEAFHGFSQSSSGVCPE